MTDPQTPNKEVQGQVYWLIESLVNRPNPHKPNADIQLATEQILTLIHRESAKEREALMEPLPLSCDKCQRLTTYLEADARNFNQGRCAYDDGRLVMWPSLIEAAFKPRGGEQS